MTLKTCAILCVVLSVLSQPVVAENIVFSQNDIRIPKGQSRVFNLGTLKQQDTTVLLDMVARLDADRLAGSSYFMKIVLNGQVVDAAKTRTLMRIVNKNLISPVAPDMPYPWFGNGAWRVLYSPDFESALGSSFYEGNPYQTTLDVTDMIKPAEENRLEIFNVCSYDPAIGSTGNYDLVIKTLAIRFKAGVSQMVTVSDTDHELVNRGTPGAGPAAYTGSIMPGGGFKIKVAGKYLSFQFTHFIPQCRYESTCGRKPPCFRWPRGVSGNHSALARRRPGHCPRSRLPDYAHRKVHPA